MALRGFEIQGAGPEAELKNLLPHKVMVSKAMYDPDDPDNLCVSSV